MSWRGYGYSGAELYHHGILGQKWGVRRYQNEDGSLTEEGKKRYGKSGDYDKASDDTKFRVESKYYTDTYKSSVKDANKLIQDDPDYKKKAALGIATKVGGNAAGFVGGLTLGMLTGNPVVAVGAAMVPQLITNTVGNRKIVEGRNKAAVNMGYKDIDDMQRQSYDKKAKSAKMQSLKSYEKSYEKKYGTRYGLASDTYRNGQKLVNLYLL